MRIRRLSHIAVGPLKMAGIFCGCGPHEAAERLRAAVPCIYTRTSFFTERLWKRAILCYNAYNCRKSLHAAGTGEAVC